MYIKYLIIGSGGQLGKEFTKTIDKKEFVAFSHKELDITNYENLSRIFEKYRPEIIINCSAYNLVDKAEGEKEKIYAFDVNSNGPRNLALLCDKYNSFLIHYSSDYVFDGKKNNCYVEEDEPNPLNEYGKSKLAGEEEIKNILKRYLIFRLSWVYGEGSQNFIYKLKKWTENNSTLKIADDEISAPTSTKTVVDITLRSLEKNIIGLYHLTNSKYCSRFEWAKFVLKELKLDNKIEAVSKDVFKLPAKRPNFSAMSNVKISKKLDVKIDDWRDALEFYINKTYKP